MRPLELKLQNKKDLPHIHASFSHDSALIISRSSVIKKIVKQVYKIINFSTICSTFLSLFQPRMSVSLPDSLIHSSTFLSLFQPCMSGSLSSPILHLFSITILTFFKKKGKKINIYNLLFPVKSSSCSKSSSESEIIESYNVSLS